MKTGREVWMQEPYEEGLANRLGPASCAGDGNIAGVAGTGVRVGQVLTSEITVPACRPCPDMGKATRPATFRGESSGDAAESETLRMRGTFHRGNRETPKISSAEARLSPIGVGPTGGCPVGRQGAVGQGRSRTADVDVFGESHGPIVPEKRANKAGTPVAESVEGRGPTKGNAIQGATRRTQSRISVGRSPCVVYGK
jgi:hypothetical protein